ncbi:hypothetical protein [Vitiosangium sp. GDMCC 1.1324]|uniref:hypothetical protein n=1 Tax=Vitiosangium sp. (strain GDMCC 1.1324) TaxID=2138576 RepID=UPI000D37D6CE|nr:hypothetical protein [Vitiosangium sp. GDMCC 1.1324]PTL77703.1 hypothetical protein DAT35_43745 [Vitiosangium sp. GDMCC 1.1324]
MVLNMKTRLMLAGAVLGASVLTLAVANAQIEPSTPQPGVPQTTPLPQPTPYDTGMDGGVGGAGSLGTYPSLLDTTDAGFGGGGLLPPSTLGGDMLDAGLR